MPFVDDTGRLLGLEIESIQADRIRRSEIADLEERYWREMLLPSTMFRPHLSQDGDKWIALYGEDLQTGVVGIGDSPCKAYMDFDRAWLENAPAQPATKEEE